MRSNIKIIFFLLSSFLVSNSFSQETQNSKCKFLKFSKLRYIGKNNSTIIINDSIHTELIEGGKYFVKSKIEWLNDCEYNATVVDCNWPKFNFPIGEVMNVKVSKIISNTIYLDLIVRNRKFKGKYLILN